jgi:copper chaperone CopZ
VRATLADQPGVKDVKVSFEAKRAVCQVASSEKFDAKKAIAALDDEGFENSTVAK